MKIVFGIIIGVAISQFGIVPMAQFIDSTYDSSIQLVQTLVKKN